MSAAGELHPSSTGLRALADFLDDCQAAGVTLGLINEASFYDLGGTGKEAACIAAIAKRLGTFKKVYSDDIFKLTADFHGIETKFVAMRENICERIVTKVEVPEEALPAREAMVIPAYTKEVVEWKCADSLLGGAA